MPVEAAVGADDGDLDFTRARLSVGALSLDAFRVLSDAGHPRAVEHDVQRGPRGRRRGQQPRRQMGGQQAQQRELLRVQRPPPRGQQPAPEGRGCHRHAQEKVQHGRPLRERACQDACPLRSVAEGRGHPVTHFQGVQQRIGAGGAALPRKNPVLLPPTAPVLLFALQPPPHLPRRLRRIRPVVRAEEADVPEPGADRDLAVAIRRAVEVDPAQHAQHATAQVGHVAPRGFGQAPVERAGPFGKTCRADRRGRRRQFVQHRLHAGHPRGRKRRHQVFFFASSASLAANVP